jgi:hypothetical protein
MIAMKKRIMGLIISIFSLLIFTSFFPMVIGLQPEPPMTYICYNSNTGIVTLIAMDNHWPGENPGINATYYKIDSGEIQTYTYPFKIPEGTHNVEYWSIDNAGNDEEHRSATFFYDSIPPTVEIITPEDGKIYLFGRFEFDRRENSEPLCIGIIPISVNAEDGEGSGVHSVYFRYNGEAGYDDDGTDGWTDTNTQAHFGSITISVIAMDNNGHISEPVEKTVKVYTFGIK